MMVQRNLRTRRAGAILALTMVCLLVVGLLASLTACSFLAQHRQAMRYERKLQAVWLAESAVQRARHRLSQMPEYSGETWKIEADVLGGQNSGRVEIQIEPVETEPAMRRVFIEAYYPDDEQQERRIVERRELLLKTVTNGENP